MSPEISFNEKELMSVSSFDSKVTKFEFAFSENSILAVCNHIPDFALDEWDTMIISPVNGQAIVIDQAETFENVKFRLDSIAIDYVAVPSGYEEIALEHMMIDMGYTS